MVVQIKSDLNRFLETYTFNLFSFAAQLFYVYNEVSILRSEYRVL